MYPIIYFLGIFLYELSKIELVSEIIFKDVKNTFKSWHFPLKSKHWLRYTPPLLMQNMGEGGIVMPMICFYGILPLYHKL